MPHHLSLGNCKLKQKRDVSTYLLKWFIRIQKACAEQDRQLRKWWNRASGKAMTLLPEAAGSQVYLGRQPSPGTGRLDRKPWVLTSLTPDNQLIFSDLFSPECPIYSNWNLCNLLRQLLSVSKRTSGSHMSLHGLIIYFYLMLVTVHCLDVSHFMYLFTY